MPAFNNRQIASFYQGAGTYNQAVSSNMGGMRRRGLGSLTSSGGTTGNGQSVIPSAGNYVTGNGLTSTAQAIGSIANSAGSLVRGVLQAESAQNAINAQKNLTNALTPGMITILLLAGVYWLVKK